MRKWILFRRRNFNVHYLWNGEYPILVTADKDLPKFNDVDVPQWGWPHVHRNDAPDAWKELFEHLEKSRQRTFKLERIEYVIEERGVFQEP